MLTGPLITGQSPRLQWKSNFPGQRRTLDEAILVAKSYGVIVGDDIAFFVDVENILPPNETARGPDMTGEPDDRATMAHLIHPETGKIPFIIGYDIFDSDEAIVAVFAHEMYEMEELRPILEERQTSITDVFILTKPGIRGNLHDKAWDLADALVERMRRERK